MKLLFLLALVVVVTAKLPPECSVKIQMCGRHLQMTFRQHCTAALQDEVKAGPTDQFLQRQVPGRRVSKRSTRSLSEACCFKPCFLVEMLEFCNDEDYFP